jgi:hypothetical protein
MHDPIKTGLIFPPTAKFAPIKNEKTTKLDYAWWGGIKTEEGRPSSICHYCQWFSNF